MTPDTRREAQALEAFLARLYTDEAAREDFLAAPEDAARQAGLAAESVRALARIDRDGLRLAAASLAHKRGAHAGMAAAVPGLWATLRRWLRRATTA